MNMTYVERLLACFSRVMSRLTTRFRIQALGLGLWMIMQKVLRTAEVYELSQTTVRSA